MLEFIDQYAPVFISLLALAAATLTSMHVLLSRREAGSSIAWMGLVWLSPILGVTLYLILGINRIKRRATSMRRNVEPFYAIPSVTPVSPVELHEHLPADAQHLAELKRVVDTIAVHPLLPGAHLEPLFNGDEAYPAMLEAIESAERSVGLVTYIFDNDAWGQKFARALGAAVRRGVEVRVLVDAAGIRYSFPSIVRALRRNGVPHARFLPSLIPPHFMTVNLRNHRKVLVVDGKLGFTGGINIRAAHVIADNPKFPTHDLHFRVQGPVVAHLQEAFADDWNFTTHERLRGSDWFPELDAAGQGFARGIADGPDEEIDKLRWTILGALTCASRSVRIVTPYFIPDTTLTHNLNLTAMRGVEVDIVLPAVNNLPYVHWASMSLLRPLLEHGCRVWFVPAPFEHSKLMVVDRQWTLLGSANMDPRSLRLNFEFNVECYDPALAARLDDHALERIARAERMTLEAYRSRSTIQKLRDGAAGLLAPYL